MPIVQPSQYQVDSMQDGDVVYVKKQKLLYRLHRKFFTDKPKIKVKRYISSVNDYVEQYQEDCTIIFGYELACVQTYDKEVPIIISTKNGKLNMVNSILKSMQVGLYNVILTFKHGLTLTIPTSYFSDAIRKNNQILKQIEDERIIKELLKFQRYKGDYFKQYVIDKNIRQWNAAYCSVCGKPLKFIFKGDIVKIDNKCECGELKLEKSEFTYDELSIWYYNQTSPNVKRIYKEFWFKKE